MTKSRKAFTLVEVVIIIVVISILAALAIAKFIGVQKNANVASLIKDMDTLEKVVTVYDTEHNSLPIISDTPVNIPDNLLKVANDIGDSGTQLYELDLSKIQDYRTKIRYGDKSKGGEDLYLYSKETNQVFYEKGLINSKNINIHCIRQLDDYAPNIKNVQLDSKRISTVTTITVDEKPNYILTGQIKKTSTLKATINGIDLSNNIIYSPVVFEINNNINSIIKNVYAEEISYKSFSLPANLDKTKTNIIQFSIPEENINFKYKVKVNSFDPKTINPILNMSQEQGLTTDTAIIFKVTPPIGITAASYEWMVDDKGVSSIPNGTFVEGTHRVSVRLKDNNGNFSEWINKSFLIEKLILNYDNSNLGTLRLVDVPGSFFASGGIGTKSMTFKDQYGRKISEYFISISSAPYYGEYASATGLNIGYYSSGMFCASGQQKLSVPEDYITASWTSRGSGNGSMYVSSVKAIDGWDNTLTSGKAITDPISFSTRPTKLLITPTVDIPQGASIKYYYSDANNINWIEIQPDQITNVSLLSTTICIKVEGTANSNKQMPKLNRLVIKSNTK